LTGWNAVKSRVEQLNLQLNDAQVKDATAKIKELADVRTQSMEDVDMILRIYHTAIKTGEHQGPHRAAQRTCARSNERARDEDALWAKSRDRRVDVSPAFQLMSEPVESVLTAGQSISFLLPCDSRMGRC